MKTRPNLIKILLISFIIIQVSLLVGCKDYRELHQQSNENKKDEKEPLSYEELYPIIVEATSRWRKVIDSDILSNLRYVIVNFDSQRIIGRSMGRGGNSIIQIEGYADWFIDKTPDRDEEFLTFQCNQQQAIHICRFIEEGNGKLDLLTIVMHEIGHKLGLYHNDIYSSLMYESVGRGVRRLPDKLLFEDAK